VNKAEVKAAAKRMLFALAPGIMTAIMSSRARAQSQRLLTNEEIHRASNEIRPYQEWLFLRPLKNDCCR
jgi:hypothetical protein